MEYIDVPCRKCLGCRQMRSAEWTWRMITELEKNPSVFITLTYDEFNIRMTDSGRYTLCKEDMIKFMKRLRQHILRKYNKNFKYYYCGEYGDVTKRPHYHIALFGVGIECFDTYKSSVPGKFSSVTIFNLWKYGINEISVLNKERIGYITGYMDKSVSEKYYNIKYGDAQVPYCRMSQSLGYDWFDKHANKIIDGTLEQKDSNGNLVSIPQSYIRRLKRLNKELPWLRRELINSKISTQAYIDKLKRNNLLESDLAILRKSAEADRLALRRINLRKKI